MYTSKDLQKIFRIGRETIRYYEKIGIIHGKVNATKYHYYDDLDIENLARIFVNTDLKLSEITGLKMYFFTGLNAALHVVPCNLSYDMICQKF